MIFSEKFLMSVTPFLDLFFLLSFTARHERVYVFVTHLLNISNRFLLSRAVSNVCVLTSSLRLLALF